jgi:hypothetical protein
MRLEKLEITLCASTPEPIKTGFPANRVYSKSNKLSEQEGKNEGA